MPTTHLEVGGLEWTTYLYVDGTTHLQVGGITHLEVGGPI